LTLILAGSIVLQFGMEYAGALLTTLLGQRVMHELRREVFGKLQRLPIPYFDRHPVGRLTTRVTSDVETLNELLSSGLVTVIGDLFTLALILGMMTVLDWRLTLVACAVIPGVMLTAALFRRRVREAFRDIRGRLAKLNTYLQEHIAGMRVVQLFGREAASLDGFKGVNKEHLDAHLRSITIYAVFFPIVEILAALALALLLWYGGLRTADATITVGVLAAFITLVRRFFQPLQDLAEKFNLLQSAMASSERIFKLLDEPDAAGEPERLPRLTRLPTPLRGEIEFHDVWFRYSEDGPWVLKGVSFVAAPGRTLALVGHTGAGKTTIISLLLRFYEVTKGRITLDGVDLREVPLDQLRDAIGFVQQDLFLFSGDILRNLTLDAGISRERAEAAARRVGADRFIDRLPERYDQVLGERGKGLSVGERQLLSFARALALDPQILVLDEATSSVDAEAEAQIQRALEELLVGRTCLVVAHRLSTILEADEILVFHHGEVRERGDHRFLLAQGGIYERLYRLQLAATV
ncbi:MAG: ABC transporter ATP-binding protein/permease, partial [Actinomycetota bacterium]|nr:ABC transporter ATP-binding protein/permease [Actinomycetota bacterium]